MKNLSKIVAIMAVTGSLSACATLTRGTTQDFVVDSSPPGASVETTSGFTCPATPCTFKMPRKDSFTVTVSKDGYETHYAEVTSNMSGDATPGMLGNVLIGGLIGVGVDATSGALNDLTPNPLMVTLKPRSASAPVPAAAPVASAADAVPVAPSGSPGS